MSSFVSLRVLLFLLILKRYDLYLSGIIVLNFSLSFCSSLSKKRLQVKILTAAECNPVPLFLILGGPALLLLDETLSVEVDGWGSHKVDADLLPSAIHSFNWYGSDSGTDTVHVDGSSFSVDDTPLLIRACGFCRRTSAYPAQL